MQTAVPDIVVIASPRFVKERSLRFVFCSCKRRCAEGNLSRGGGGIVDESVLFFRLKSVRSATRSLAQACGHLAPSRHNPILLRPDAPPWTVHAAHAVLPRRGRGESAVPCGPRLPYAVTYLRHGGACGRHFDVFRALCLCLSASSGHARLVYAPVARLCFDAVPCDLHPLDRCEVWTARFRVLLLVHRESQRVRIEVASSVETAEIVLEVGRGTR